MGHTHRPVTESIAEGVTYVNLGGWAVDDLDHEQTAPAPCTHLVIQASGAGLSAELRRWCSGEGPALVRAIEAPFPAAVLAATALGGEDHATVTAST
jgi:hypothetical protein